MSPPDHTPEDLFTRGEHVVSIVERLMRWQMAIICCTAAGVLWGARLEFRSADHEARIAKLEVRDEKLAELVQTLRSDNLLLRQMLDTMRASQKTSQRVDVKVGAMAAEQSAADRAAQARGYYLVSEVAGILRKDERTITQMCSDGKLTGAWRDKESGSSPWKIPLSLLLGVGDGSGKQPLTAAIIRKPKEDEEP